MAAVKGAINENYNHHLLELLEFEYKWAQGIEEQVIFSNKEFKLLELEFKIKKRRILVHQRYSSHSPIATKNWRFSS